MTTQTAQKTQRISVQFQLLLDTLQEAVRGVYALNCFLASSVDFPYGFILMRDWKQIEPQASKLLTPLACYPTDKGTIARLRNDAYKLCCLLPGDSTARRLAQFANEAWAESHKAAYSLALGIKDHTQVPKLIRSFFALQRCIHLFAENWPSCAMQIKDDENLLFFLLTHQRELDALCPQTRIAELLKKWHPAGKARLKEHLVGRYKKRGFHELLATIEKRLDALSWT